MGGIIAFVRDGVPSTVAEHYETWTDVTVKAAFTRWCKVLEGIAKKADADVGGRDATDGIPKSIYARHRMTTRQYWEVFTEYSVVMPKEGGFLSLPLSEFHRYKPAEDNTICALEPMLALSLLCAGTVEAKRDMIFTIVTQPFSTSSNPFLDVDGSFTMPYVAVVEAIHTFVVTCVALQVIKMPTKREIASAAHNLMVGADINKNERIARDEFARWCSVYANTAGNNFLSQMVPSTDDGHTRGRRRSFVSVEQNAITGFAAVTRTVEDHSSSLSKSIREATHEAEDSKTAVVTNRRGSAMSTMSSVSKTSKGSRAPPIPADVGAFPMLDPADFPSIEEYREVVAMMRKTHDLKLKVVANKRVLTELVSMGVSFSRAELLALAKQFASQSGATGYMDPLTFRAALKSHLPAVATSAEDIFARVFAVCDKDQDGRLNFKEFALGLSNISKGSLKEKMEFVFRMFDLDDNGYISVSELVTFVRQGNAELRHVIQYSQEMLESLDVNGDGLMSKSEFATALRREPGVLDTLSRCLAIDVIKARAVHDFAKSHFKLTDTLVRRVLRDQEHRTRLRVRVDLGPGRVTNRLALDKNEFWEYMMAFFEVTPDLRPKCDRLFDNFEIEGRIVLREILKAFIQCLVEEPEEQATLYFELFDSDGDGELNTNEIMFMLLSATADNDAAAAVVLDALAFLDKNGDGHISYSEFMARATREPQMMRALEAIFNVRGEVVALHSIHAPQPIVHGELAAGHVGRLNAMPPTALPPAPVPKQTSSNSAGGVAGSHLPRYASSGSAAEATPGRRMRPAGDAASPRSAAGSAVSPRSAPGGTSAPPIIVPAAPTGTNKAPSEAVPTLRLPRRHGHGRHTAAVTERELPKLSGNDQQRKKHMAPVPPPMTSRDVSTARTARFSAAPTPPRTVEVSPIRVQSGRIAPLLSGREPTTVYQRNAANVLLPPVQGQVLRT